MKKGVEIFSLKEKTVLLTGATGHLGRSMAFIFAEAGANVLINSRSVDRNNQLVSELTTAGLLAESATFDVTSASGVKEFVAKRRNQPLHVLVNNAYAGGSGNIRSSADAAYSDSYDVAVIAAHRLLASLLPNLRMAVHLTGDASVINISSMYALVSPDQHIYKSKILSNPPFYGAAKAALLQWTRYAACEFGSERIRVNAISPGPFPADAVRHCDPEFILNLNKRVPLGRTGSSHEIKGPALFLASTASSFVNGANLIVDGGWTVW